VLSVTAATAAAAPAGLSFEVLSLERQVQGSNLPLPKTLIKSLLNVVMPSVSCVTLQQQQPQQQHQVYHSSSKF
jgi:hypothetical protein